MDIRASPDEANAALWLAIDKYGGIYDSLRPVR